LFDKDAWLVRKHFLDGGLGCLSCHSGHSVNDKFLVKDKIVDVCFACHSAIRDDFEAGEHNGADPATMTCVTCHNPHNVGRSAQAPENN
jgi:predicted CXXCH cytochrome family protein